MKLTAPSFPQRPVDDHEERDVLVLEFQRLTRRLAQVGLLSLRGSARFIREVSRRHAAAEAAGRALPALLRQLLLGIEDGTLVEGRDYLRRGPDVVALHLESTALWMYRAQRTALTARDMRRLFHFGWLHVREVVSARSERVTFGAKESRRRTVMLNLAKAYEFVGGRFRCPTPAS